MVARYLLAAAGLVVALTGAAFAQCYDVSKNQPRYLEGRLSYRVFPGAPNFQDVRKGDAPEPGYVLRLDKPICIDGDEGFADPDVFFPEVQVVPFNEELDGRMRSLSETEIGAELDDAMAAMNGHHHRPLVVRAIAIAPRGDAARAAAEAAGGAAAVTAFYEALAKGDGALASSLVIPEKRAEGPFSAKALSGFYGDLKQPLRLLSVIQSGARRFDVEYHFVSAFGHCNGLATVSAVERDGRSLVQSISVHNGC